MDWPRRAKAVIQARRRSCDEKEMPADETTKVPVECQKLLRALTECHRRIPPGSIREASCRHLNRATAQCLVSVACPQESEAVRSLCVSGGTSLKRSQCEQAQLSLSVCLSSLQIDS